MGEDCGWNMMIWWISDSAKSSKHSVAVSSCWYHCTIAPVLMTGNLAVYSSTLKTILKIFHLLLWGLIFCPFSSLGQVWLPIFQYWHMVITQWQLLPSHNQRNCVGLSQNHCCWISTLVHGDKAVQHEINSFNSNCALWQLHNLNIMKEFTAINEWHSLPQNIRESHSLEIFKKTN